MRIGYSYGIYQNLRLSTSYGESCLPETTKFCNEIKFSKLRHRSPADRVLYLVYPEIRPMIKAFYKGHGPPLRDVLTQRQILVLDASLLAQFREFNNE